MNEETTDLVALKNLLYDTLAADDEESTSTDITASQNLGVSLTNAIKKDGVQIFQLQSVVSKKVTNNIVKSLKIVDKLQDQERLPVSTSKELTMDHVIQVIEWLASKKLPLKKFDKLMRGLYVTKVLSDCDNGALAAELLEVSGSQVHKLRRDGKEAIQTINDDMKQLEVVDE